MDKLKNILLIVVISSCVSVISIFISLKYIAKPNQYINNEVRLADENNHPFTQPTFTGTQATIDTLDPYITVYMWKRTA